MYGEIGELLTIAKKKYRESYIFAERQNIIESLGDVFWYLCCLINRLNLDLNNSFNHFLNKNKIDLDKWQKNLSSEDKKVLIFEENHLLKNLGKLAGNFLCKESLAKEEIFLFSKYFFALVITYEVNFNKVLDANYEKISSRFIKYKKSDLLDFDEKFPEFERLPKNFKIEFVEKQKKVIAMRWNGVFIGDPLSDNSSQPDGYRFHDVFHFSYAAMLHWSPTFRGLIKHKRKSDSDIDKSQDGGRAIVVEEGLSAWIFNIAKENKLFEDTKRLPFDMLKNISQIVDGLEVEQCPMLLWEETILKGYEVFRKVKKNNGGIIIGDRTKRTISYRK